MFTRLDARLAAFLHEHRLSTHALMLLTPMVLVLTLGGMIFVFAPVSSKHDQQSGAGSQPTPVAAKPLNTAQLLQSEQSTVPPPSNTSITSASKVTTPATTPTPAYTPPTRAPQPSTRTHTPAPAGHATVTISSNGCRVTAVGTPGLTFIVGVYTPTNSKGGRATYRIPADGSISAYDGGVRYEIAFGEVDDANGNQIARTNAAITAKSCAV